jgi:DNA excision repair protein ERCC-6
MASHSEEVTSGLQADIVDDGGDQRSGEDEFQQHQQGEEQLKGDMDEQATLDFLATAKDQDELERDIGRQADHLLTEQADERDNKRLEKTETQRQRLRAQLKKVDQRLNVPGGSRTTTLLLNEKQKLETDIKTAELELEQIKTRIAERRHGLEEAEEGRQDGAGDGQQPGESRRDFLIRTGKITPFSKMPQISRMSSNLADVMLEAEAQDEDEDGEAEVDLEATAGPRSHQVLRRPGFADDETPATSSAGESTPRKKQKLQSKLQRRRQLGSASEASDDAFDPDEHEGRLSELGVSESDSDAEAARALASEPVRKRKRGAKAAKARRRQESEDEVEGDLAGLDDGNEDAYQRRVRTWVKKRSTARRRAQEARRETAASTGGVTAPEGDESLEEWHKPHPTRADTFLEGGLRIPGDIYPSLYDYQKTGVRWLWELYSQQVGGIVGDEMGLGKTIQAISFLAGLHYSKMLNKPCIIVCPATVMKQWSNEFHTWWPALRVSILHSSGSGMMDVRREEELEDELDNENWDEDQPRRSKNHQTAKRIVDRVIQDGHVLVTTYSGLQTYSNLLINVDWGYAVLDEGHKIRNPNTAITIYCKELRTANRIILSGTPIQNNLTELWSLFDFVFPMRLGTLVSFRTQFETPIRIGGYANASNLQVETAIRCAEALKETISPYLLQRWKVDVAADLPKKTERVLFCEITPLQRQQYQIFLDSEEMKSILAGKRHSLYGIDILRKICNHPDLVDHKRSSHKPGYGEPSKSGKMRVVKGLLEMWKKAGHKTLLFAQHRIMLDILEKFISSIGGFKYRRMDGNTSIKERQDLVDEFNKDQDLHVFLLTTKVGGLGVNLTGANRVIIYDPDWNPSTDIQARERAWRLGQKREVEIYRLMTAGTIEEKIYHRQVFKQILTNKVLKDPKQRQTFHLRELHDLFTLGDKSDGTETGSLFKGSELKLSKKTSLPTPPSDKDETDNAARASALRGLAREEEYQGADHGKEKATDGEAGGEDRILSAIFSKSGVHSAHEHEAIISGGALKPKVTADPEMITREARRVAAIAAQELQRAGEAARNVPIGVPTWTGTHGVAGRPEERSRALPIGRGAGRGRGGGAGPSSSSILSNLAARQTADTSSASSRRDSPAAGQPRGKDFMILIRDYLRAHGGSVYTQMLIDHFNRYCGTEQRTAEFKEMLTKIAKLDRGRNGRGKWVLKDEFRA